MPKKPKTKPAAKEPELPGWLTGTPAMEYALEAFFDQDQQHIELTMDEYEALKCHLAKMRGHQTPKRGHEMERQHSPASRWTKEEANA